jgi:hypothetical protein
MEVKWNSKRILKGGQSIGEMTRFLSIMMKFNLPEETKNHLKTQNLCLTTIYSPHSGYNEKELEQFNSDVFSCLSTILPMKRTVHIIGADTNALIGMLNKTVRDDDARNDKTETLSEEDPITNLLGPNGNHHRSKMGEAILNLMREFELRAASTFFDNNGQYNAWLGLPDAHTREKSIQIDQILIPKLQLCQTKNVKHRFDGVASDHAALRIDFHFLIAPLLKNRNDKAKLPPIDKKIDSMALRASKLQAFQERVNEFFEKLTPELAFLSSPSKLLNELRNT